MKANYNFEVIRNEKKQEKLKEVIKNFDLNNASMVILYRYYLMKLMPLFDGEIPDLSQRIDDDFCDAMAMETAGFVSDAVNNAVSAFIENDGKESFRVDYDGTEDEFKEELEDSVLIELGQQFEHEFLDFNRETGISRVDYETSAAIFISNIEESGSSITEYFRGALTARPELCDNDNEENNSVDNTDDNS